MQTVFDACTPRSDVLTGELRDDMFAAQLGDVIEERADLIYRDPALFFSNTYPTVGLRTLTQEVFTRLSGKAGGSAVIRLETSFGSGKTHNLIALYHLVHSMVPADVAARFVDPTLLPAAGQVMVGGVVGSDLELSGLDHGDAKTHTVWGEIAYRLGGRAGFQLVQDTDEEGGQHQAASSSSRLHRKLPSSSCLTR